MDPAKADIRATRQVCGDEQIRVRHPDMPGVRWLHKSEKGTGFYSRNVAAVCYFLPTAEAWEKYQQRQQLS